MCISNLSQLRCESLTIRSYLAPSQRVNYMIKNETKHVTIEMFFSIVDVLIVDHTRTKQEDNHDKKLIIINRRK